MCEDQGLVAGEKIGANLGGQHGEMPARANEKIQPAVRLVAECSGKQVGFEPVHVSFIIIGVWAESRNPRNSAAKNGVSYPKDASLLIEGIEKFYGSRK